MALCPTEAATQQAIAPPPTIPAPPPAPMLVRTTDTKAMWIAGAAGAALATSVCFLVAANDANNDAASATLFSDHSAIAARSTALYIASAATGALGIGLAVAAVMRVRSSREHATKLAISPHPHGGAIVLERSW
jgi:hypothetical protein